MGQRLFRMLLSLRNAGHAEDMLKGWVFEASLQGRASCGLWGEPAGNLLIWKKGLLRVRPRARGAYPCPPQSCRRATLRLTPPLRRASGSAGFALRGRLPRCGLSLQLLSRPILVGNHKHTFYTHAHMPRARSATREAYALSARMRYAPPRACTACALATGVFVDATI